MLQKVNYHKILLAIGSNGDSTIGNISEDWKRTIKYGFEEGDLKITSCLCSLCSLWILWSEIIANTRLQFFLQRSEKIWTESLCLCFPSSVNEWYQDKKKRSEAQTHLLLHVDDSYSKEKSHSVSVGAENGGNWQWGLGVLSIFWGIGILPICVF